VDKLLVARVRALGRPDGVLEDIDEELRAHIEMEVEANRELGMQPAGYQPGEPQRLIRWWPSGTSDPIAAGSAGGPPAIVWSVRPSKQAGRLRSQLAW
jgi:hypothetical protein